MKKVIVYVDGFNFYHATKELNFPGAASVDLGSLAASLPTEGHELVGVEYFSAYARWRPESYLKHRRYVAKLEEIGVHITMAHFKKKHRQCFACGAQWQEHEEKETDVRIALKILEDAVDNRYDTAFILSGDSDLVPVIESIKQRCPAKRLLIALPKHRFALARDLRRVAHGAVALSPGRIRKHLFSV